MPRLTASRVKAAQPADRPYCLWCSDLPGFGCRINPSGARTYVVRYRNAGGMTRTLTLGSAAKMAGDQARALALQAFAAVSAGADPAADRSAIRQAPTVADVFERWQRDLAPRLKPASVESYARNWRLHIAPAWAARKAADIDLDAVQRLHSSLHRTPALANRVLAFVSVLLTAAEGWKMRPLRSNPCHLVERYQERRRGMVPEPDQLPALWAAIEALQEAAGDAKHPVMTRRHAGYFALLLLTGCRRSELLCARKEDVRRDRGVLLLRDTKTNADGDPEHVELTADHLAVIDALPADPFSPWLFPGLRAGKRMVAPYRRWQAVAKAAGLDGMRLHDLRHTVGTYAHQAGGSQRVVAQLLRHKQLSTTERYTHGFNAVRRAAAVATVTALLRPGK